MVEVNILRTNHLCLQLSPNSKLEKKDCNVLERPRETNKLVKKINQDFVYTFEKKLMVFLRNLALFDTPRSVVHGYLPPRPITPSVLGETRFQ